MSPVSRAGPNAATAIGFAVFIAHLVMLPIDGCASIGGGMWGYCSLRCSRSAPACILHNLARDRTWYSLPPGAGGQGQI